MPIWLISRSLNITVLFSSSSALAKLFIDALYRKQSVISLASLSQSSIKMRYCGFGWFCSVYKIKFLTSVEVILWLGIALHLRVIS